MQQQHKSQQHLWAAERAIDLDWIGLMSNQIKSFKPQTECHSTRICSMSDVPSWKHEDNRIMNINIASELENILNTFLA